MKISEWLEEHGSHSIYDAVVAQQSFRDMTGHEPKDWPVHSQQDTLAIMENRGLGGDLTTDQNARLVYGYELAEHLAFQFANGFKPPGFISGRGFRFNHCVTALKEAGQ